ncbi:MAG TPA: J domain-containing protein [Candidatus Obscuribacterales bacterium]
MFFNDLLVMVWHPDRMQNAAGRLEAEEELKRINNAFDVLKNHFERDHKAGALCACQPAPTPGSQTQADSTHRRSSQAAGGAYSQTSDPEAEARRRQEERQRKAEEDARRAAAEAARKTAEQQQAADAAKRATEDALKQAHALNEDRLRWRLAMAGLTALAAILIFGWAGMAARNCIKDLQKNWQQPHQENPTTPQSSSPNNADSPAPPAGDPDNPYIPLQYRFPGGNPSTWRKFMEQEERKQRARDDEQRRQDIYFTKLAIDRNLKIIDHCNNTIAQLEAKIADPYISDVERNKLIDYRDFQRQNLEAAQRELAVEQDKLQQLEGSAPPA